MSKTWIVLKSEFSRRVRSKWFILTTLLGPLFLMLLMIAPAAIGYLAAEGHERRIAVVDETGVLAEALAEASSERFLFTSTEQPTEAVRAAVMNEELDGYLVLPEGLIRGEASAAYYSAEGGGLSLGAELESIVDDLVDDYRLEAQNAPPEVLEILESRTEVRLMKLTEEGELADSTAASAALGFILGFIIYIAMFIYGAYVMHGVMEEKQSRVLEVVVSSVRPFELLMGKVLGIGAMGLVQMGAWAVFLLGLSMAAGGIASVFLDPADLNLPQNVSGEEMLAQTNFALPDLSPEIFIWFLLFFLGGYLLYASLFAAVGSSVEHQQDAQGLMMPVTIVIIIPLMFIAVLVEDPNTPLAIALSMIPFFSPILMVVRVAVTNVPFWQVALSFLILCLTFVGTIWVCGRIYRVGILMYGKKPTLRDLVRWFRYS